MLPSSPTDSLTSALLVSAFRAYQVLAYPGGTIPANRKHFADLSPEMSLAEILALPGVECPKAGTGTPAPTYRFRLGCEWYPHMKVVVSLVGPQLDPVFAVDTHDQLFIPADSPEAGPLRELQARNLELAHRIQEAWEKEGIPTQVSQLRQYLDGQRAKVRAPSRSNGDEAPN